MYTSYFKMGGMNALLNFIIKFEIIFHDRKLYRRDYLCRRFNFLKILSILIEEIIKESKLNFS